MLKLETRRPVGSFGWGGGPGVEEEEEGKGVARIIVRGWGTRRIMVRT